MKCILTVLCFFFVCLPVWSQSFDILDFGAKPDGTTLNTAAIQNAIDIAHEGGGGEVRVPPGVFLTGSIVLKSKVNLHIEAGATLLGSPNPAHYQKLTRWPALILADKQQNLSITGKGVIDGQGRKVALAVDSLFYAGALDSVLYDVGNKRPREWTRPQLIEFVNCQHIEVRQITLRNAACWVQTYDKSSHIQIDSVTVYSDAYWNNDGLDISDCQHVRITHCDINSADDGICLKSHKPFLHCDSVYIGHCRVRSSASAVKFGTKSLGGFKHVRIEDIEVYDTYRSAIAIESVDGGFLEDVVVDGVHAVNTGNALFIRVGQRRKGSPPGTIKDVTIRNMQVEVAFGRPDGAYEIRGPALPFFHNTFPCSITGIPDQAVEDITLENIRIMYPGRGNKGLAYLPLSRLDDIPEEEAAYPEFSMFGELPAWGFYMRHIRGITMENIRISIKEPDYRPAMVLDDVQELQIEDFEVFGHTKPSQIILHKSEAIYIGGEHKVLRQ